MFSRFLVLFRNQPTRTAGFSLIELLVSIGIIILVLSVVVVNQNAFNSAVLLRSQAYEIALDVREVQLSAVSAQTDGATFRRVQGVHFSLNTPDRYMVFTDDNDFDGVDEDNEFFYEADELNISGLQRLDPRFEIAAIRRFDGTSLFDVASDEVSISYTRPNFDASFRTAFNSTVHTNSQYIEIDVALVGATGSVCGVDLRTIEITNTGQVTVLRCP